MFTSPITVSARGATLLLIVVSSLTLTSVVTLAVLRGATAYRMQLEVAQHKEEIAFIRDHDARWRGEIEARLGVLERATTTPQPPPRIYVVRPPAEQWQLNRDALLREQIHQLQRQVFGKKE